MRQIFIMIFSLMIASSLFGQVDRVNELIAQGVELHDQAKYDEAISKYKAALKLDKKSTLANYELSYTYFVTQQYKEAIKYSTNVIKLKADHQQAAYVVLGNSLDLVGKPLKAIKTYEEGLLQFPKSNLLNYNLAFTCLNQKQYDKAETAAINAILAKPSHGSSHIVLSAIMQAKGQRVQSILSLYYFLMLEPNSKRSNISYNNLRNQLGQGVEKKDEKIVNVTIPFASTLTSEFCSAEMMISLLAASNHVDENKDKSDMELFIKTNRGVFGMLGELNKNKSGFWWDFYVTKFYDLVQSGNCEAYSYFISQSSNNDYVIKWMKEHPEEMRKLAAWIKK